MAEICRVWSDTAVPGLQIRRAAGTIVGIRLMGWEALLPLSVVQDAIGQDTHVRVLPAHASSSFTQPRYYGQR